MPNIKTVIHFTEDDTVKVINDNEKEIPRLQGKYEDVKTAISDVKIILREDF